MRLLPFLALLTVPTSASAADLRPCDMAETSAVFLAEPWEANTQVFANGNVRLAILDLIEPAAGAFHLLVLSPPFDDVGQATCQVISFTDGLGFREMSLENMQSTYDPAIGLSFEIPIAVGPNPHDNGVLFFTLNQATGVIDAEVIGS